MRGRAFAVRWSISDAEIAPEEGGYSGCNMRRKVMGRLRADEGFLSKSNRLRAGHTLRGGVV
jgi:hypothetical protein